MPGSVEIILRTLTAFVLLWVFVHMLGKQTIFQKAYHLFIATITMGTIAGNLAFNINIKVRYFILAFLMMGAIIFTLNFLSVKFHRYKKWIEGEAHFLIQDGKIMEESLKKIGYSLGMLTQALRGKDIFNLEEVECAILEVNGSLSVLKKAEYQNVTRKDIQLFPSPNKVPVELVFEGKLLEENLSNHGTDKDWVLAQLKKRNLQVTEISYAVIGSNGNLYIDLFKDHSS
jgi:uncharacterized membrane protein YcaP (DUF421 family)